jgi:uncharacterized protein (TIGR02145 family)
MKKNLIYYGLLSTLMFALPLLTISCTSSDDESNTEKGEGQVRVTLAKSSFDSALTRAAIAPQTKIIDFGNDLQLEATLTPDNDAATRAETNNLASEVKYCIVIYDKNGNFAASKEYTHGSEADEKPIPLTAGEGYKYIAYSINTSGVLPTYVRSPFSVTTTDAADLMLAQGTFGVHPDNTTKLTIDLKHQFSSVAVKIDASAIGQPVTAVSGMTIKPHYTSATVNYSGTESQATFNGLASTQSIEFGTLPASAVALSQSVIVYSNTNGGSDITIGSLTIGSDTKTNKVASGYSVVPKTKYTLTIKVKKPADPIEQGGLIWAPANLVYNGNWPNGTYGFAANQGEQGNTWSLNNVKPSDTSNDQYGDPCALVAPAGTWRTPSYDDFAKIVRYANGEHGSVTNENTTFGSEITYFNGTENKKGQYFGTMTKPSVENQDKYLFLPHVINGYYTIKQEPYNGDKRSVLQLGDNYGSQFIHNLWEKELSSIRCVKN